jgi:phytanoyl-CoA dioxygenase PhyH
MNTLVQTGLTTEQHEHFTEHGWVLLENVLDTQQCQTYIDAIDECLDYYDDAWVESGNVDWLYNLHLRSPRFLDWFKLPGMIAGIERLVGTDSIHVINTVAAVTEPHPDRHDRREALADQSTWGWHRAFSNPRHVSSQDATNPHLLNSGMVIAFTYLTPVAAEHGVTAILDMSHTLDGTPDELRARCDVVQLEAAPGCVLLFTESLVHSSAPVLSDVTRYALIYDFVPTWWIQNSAFEAPPMWTKSLRDEDVRRLFARGDCTDGGQI